MPIDFYYLPLSIPCRAVLLTAEAIGIDLNLKVVDLMKKEHLNKDFIKINPQHTVPTIDDNGFILWESRAIITYLVSKYGKNDSLYPKDPKKRAIVDQRLYFDAGTLFVCFIDYYRPAFHGGEYDPAKLEKIKEALEFFNIFLEGQDYVAGNSLTVADLSLVATVSSLDVAGYDFSGFSNVKRWYEKVKATAPGYEEANGKNVLLLKPFLNKS